MRSKPIGGERRVLVYPGSEFSFEIQSAYGSNEASVSSRGKSKDRSLADLTSPRDHLLVAPDRHQGEGTAPS